MLGLLTSVALVVMLAAGGTGLGFGSLFRADGLWGVSLTVLAMAGGGILEHCVFKISAKFLTVYALVAVVASSIQAYAMHCVTTTCPSGRGCGPGCEALDLESFAFRWEPPAWLAWITDLENTTTKWVNLIPETASWVMLFGSMSLMVLSILQWDEFLGRSGGTKTVVKVVKVPVPVPPRPRPRRSRARGGGGPAFDELRAGDNLREFV